MKHSIIFILISFLINTMPICINAASNVDMSIYPETQSAFIISNKQKSNNRHHNILKKWIRKNIALNKLKPTKDPNGKLAILLTLASSAMLIFPPALPVLFLVAYLAAILFAILGLMKDEHKAYSIFALVFLIIPIILLLAFLISCKKHGCFE
ncbi:MAG: hypothetical protein GC192_08195 [Bacteroidetes bacterium]|nr:hypothetical protein [Bacteroidota bacterium]